MKEIVLHNCILHVLNYRFHMPKTKTETKSKNKMIASFYSNITVKSGAVSQKMDPNFNPVNLNPQNINWVHNFNATNPNNFPIQRPPISRRKFTHEEDEKLKSLVSTFGVGDWRNIAAHMDNRNARQCRERWKHYLSPTVSNGPWTETEDELLRIKYNELGPQWSRIAKFFPTRTDITVKNRWISMNGRARRASIKQISFEPVGLHIPPPVAPTYERPHEVFQRDEGHPAEAGHAQDHPQGEYP